MYENLSLKYTTPEIDTSNTDSSIISSMTSAISQVQKMPSLAVWKSPKAG